MKFLNIILFLIWSFVLIKPSFQVFITNIENDPSTSHLPTNVDIDSSISLQHQQQVQQHNHSLQQSIKKKRKRGRKGGVKARSRRRRDAPVLPVIVTGNARSLNNKIDELSACTKYLHEYRDASILCFSESWFKDCMPDSSVQLDGFHIVRGDRDNVISQKTKGGGVCIYVNKRYCHPKNIHIIQRKCERDIEVLSISLRPFYLPREFSKVIVNVVYVPDAVPSESATAQLTDLLNEQMTSSPDSLIIITGDFNHTRLNPSLPFYQHVDCTTRKNATLDLCYTNVEKSYKCVSMPPLGASDHDMLLLLPKYKTRLIQNQVIEKCVSVWDKAGRERLADCFESTNWDVFIDACDNIDELNDTVSSYIIFCEENCIEKKTVKCYGNDKPWITIEMKSLLKEKRRSYYNQISSEQKKVRKLVNDKILECKNVYKNKIENKFYSNDSKGVWEGLKTIVGFKSKQSAIFIEKGREQSYADDLNKFYCRFDSQDFSKEINTIKSDLQKDSDEPSFIIENHTVLKSFLSLKSSKACGSDNIKPFVLKTFARELCYIFTYIFNLSIELKRLPATWKLSKIVPVPKSNNVKELNDLRPIALTSTLVKILERIVMNNFLPICQPFLDPLQFAYRKNRGVEDAILSFTHNLYKHIDQPKCYVRTLFIDFSSAFNTIQRNF